MRCEGLVYTMAPPVIARSSGLDISLLGVIVTGIGFSLNHVADAAGTMPHLIRFFDKPQGTSYPAATPQDSALLLLTDPSTTASSATSGTAPAVSLGALPTLLVVLGVVLVVAGPLWTWYHR